MANLFNTMALTPSGLPSGLIFWGNGSQTPVGGVASWSDLSGVSGAATQPTGGKQPVSTASQLNGKNTLLFASASSQNLILPSSLYTLNNGDNTIFCVAKRTSETGATTRIVELVEAGVATYLSINFGATAGDINYRNGAANSIATSSGNTNTNYNIIMGRRNGITTAVSVNNGAEVTTANGANGGTTNAAHIGANNGTSLFLNGALAELLIFNRSLTAAEILQVNKYLSLKWLITLN